MKISIIVAMQKELKLLLPLLADRTERQALGATIYEGSVGPHSVAVMQCGIGKVNAALGTVALIDATMPELVINTGVAGGTGSDARVLDVVVGSSVAYHDVWCGPCGAPRGCVQGMPQFFAAPDRLINSPAIRNSDAKVGLIASGDRFVDSPDQLAAIREIYPDVMAVDMESAAIAHTCHVKGVPFLSLRVVSDTPGQESDNTAQYSNFWEAAPQQTFILVESLLKSL